MADEGSSMYISTPPRELQLEKTESTEDYQVDWWLQDVNDINDAGGPSSIEVQPDITSSPCSISLSSRSGDFNELSSPNHPFIGTECGDDLDIMGIANTWNEEDAFTSESPVPLKEIELPCLIAGQGSHSQPLPSPTTLEFFEEDPESVCNLIGNVPDSDGCPGICGLHNLGNTCFMNAGLQCLFGTTPLLNFFLSNSVEKDKSSGSGPNLSSQFATLLLKVWSGHFRTIRPAEFKHVLGTYYAQFKDYRQHDCQEFLALLLDAMHEETTEIELKANTMHSEIHHEALGNATADAPIDYCSLSLPGEAIDFYESSRSSQLSSPLSSDSVETSSSCTNSCSSTIKGTALSLRSLPIPEEVKEPPFPASVSALENRCNLGQCAVQSVDILSKNTIIMERNLLNRSLDASSPLLEKNLLCEISSMIKDSKTANVNIASTPEEPAANNEIYFDSVKFPHSEAVKPRVAAAVASALLRNSAPIKNCFSAKNKLKMTNVLKETTKRLSDNSERPCSPSPIPSFNGVNLDVAKNDARLRKKPRTIESQIEDRQLVSLEKCQPANRQWPADPAEEPADHEVIAVKDEKVPLNFLSTAKKSVITETFQGQFRSTVVCFSCKHVSVTYEPFMYLSVPLPKAMERIIEVTYIGISAISNPTHHQLVLQKYDEIRKLRQSLAEVLHLDEEQFGRLVLAEIVNRHVVRILEDQLLLRHLKDGHRSVYAFLVPLPPVPSISGFKTKPALSPCSPTGTISKELAGENPSLATGSWKSCAICLEEMADKDLRIHTSCSCLLCQSCIEASCRHRGGNEQCLVCPVCGILVKPNEEFAPLDRLHHYRPVIRLLNIPVVFRWGTTSSGTAQSCRLVGCPRILRLPSILLSHTLYIAVEQLLPEGVPFDLCYVDYQGMRCTRCLYPVRCYGCKISKGTSEIAFQPGDCLGVHITNLESDDSNFLNWIGLTSDEATGKSNVQEVSDDSRASTKETLTLDDCLRAFSESEILDERNPWFCPKCQKNQCASKTLRIYQAPPYIIIYLKRFVFHNSTSAKLDNRVKFPLTGLSLEPYIYWNDESSNSSVDLIYDLYAVVCHYGNASSGHYTAYAKHINTGEWHYYNDETVVSRIPQENDFSHGYILFYHKRSIGHLNPNELEIENLTQQ